MITNFKKIETNNIFKLIWCLIFKHRMIKSKALNYKSLITITSGTDIVIDVNLCDRCHLIYWEKID